MKNVFIRQGRRLLSAILAATLIWTAVFADPYVEAAEDEEKVVSSEYEEYPAGKLETPELTADDFEVAETSVRVENDRQVVVRVANLEVFGDRAEIHYKETGKATIQYSVKSPVPSKGKMMFYVIDTNTKERLSKNSAPVTVQTIPLKKSFKLNTSYKLSTSSGKSVELKGRAAGVAQVTYKGLYNVSVKGKSNYFTELFELGEDQKLKLKNSISKRLLKDQKNLTGYVYLEVTYLDGTTAEMYQKITVKLTK